MSSRISEIIESINYFLDRRQERVHLLGPEYKLFSEVGLALLANQVLLLFCEKVVLLVQCQVHFFGELEYKIAYLLNVFL